MGEAKPLQAEDDQRRVATGAAELERQKDITRAAYLSSGRTAAAFEQEWPGMKQRRLAEPGMAEAWRNQSRING